MDNIIIFNCSWKFFVSCTYIFKQKLKARGSCYHSTIIINFASTLFKLGALHLVSIHSKLHESWSLFSYSVNLILSKGEKFPQIFFGSIWQQSNTSTILFSLCDLRYILCSLFWIVSIWWSVFYSQLIIRFFWGPRQSIQFGMFYFNKMTLYNSVSQHFLIHGIL